MTRKKTMPLPVGTVLRLQPLHDRAALPLHFVARPDFVIGRFSVAGVSVADFSGPLPARGQPPSVISRRHVLLRHGGGLIYVRDASESKDKATGGTRLDDKVLGSDPVPADFVRERAFVLGEKLGEPFTVQARLLPATVDMEATLAVVSSAPALTGCLRFAATVPVPADVVWLFSEATLGSAAGSAIVLPGLPAAFVRVHHQRKAFWVEPLCAPPSVRLSEDLLPCEERTPLQDGTVLRLGPLAYQVSIEA